MSSLQPNAYTLRWLSHHAPLYHITRDYLPTHVNYQSQSIAKQNISSYSSNPTVFTSPSTPVPVLTRKNDGLDYPTDNTSTFVRKYLITFKGCFGCSSIEYQFPTCSLVQNPVTRHQYWKGLWIHKPATKRRPNFSQNLPLDRNSSHYDPIQLSPPSGISREYHLSALNSDFALVHSLSQGCQANIPSLVTPSSPNPSNTTKFLTPALINTPDESRANGLDS